MSINLKKRMTTGPTTAFVSCVNLPQQERDITMQEARMITGGNTDITGDEYERRGMTRPPTQNGRGIQQRGGGGSGGGRGTGLFRALFGGSGDSEGSGDSGGESISELGFVTTVRDNTRVGN